jgi:hypothetical protein
MKEPWYVQLMFPILKSKDSRSELSSLKTNMDFDPSKDFKDYNS